MAFPNAGHIGAEGASAPNLYEPQRQNMFVMEFYVEGQEILQLSLAVGFLPSENSEEIEIQFGNESVFFAGRTAWDAGSVTFNDYVDAGTARMINQWRDLVRNAETGAVGYASEYKKTGRALLYGPDGVSNERSWKLVGCWPQAVNWSSGMDYSSSDRNQVEVTLRFDKAIPESL